jgi:AmmeMemoRadiSam system protein B
VIEAAHVDPLAKSPLKQSSTDALQVDSSPRIRSDSVVVMLVAAKFLGAKTAKLIKYQTSGDTTGDKSSVVGYAGIVIT